MKFGGLEESAQVSLEVEVVYLEGIAISGLCFFSFGGDTYATSTRFSRPWIPCPWSDFKDRILATSLYLDFIYKCALPLEKEQSGGCQKNDKRLPNK